MATVSKGTYIRSLARDIALALGTVGHVTMLRRTEGRAVHAGKRDFAGHLWRIWAKARTLEQALLPLTAGLDDIPALPVTPDQAGALRQGRPVIGIAATPGPYLATAGRLFRSPSSRVTGSGIKVVRGFNL